MTRESTPEYLVGHRISVAFRRSWLEIWRERITTWRWHVPQTETRWFQCTSADAGAIWLELK